MIYKPFSILTLPFPFTDKNVTKKRPALVLSNENFQEECQQITVMMITSAKNSSWSSDVSVRDLKDSGLPSACVIRQKIFTIDSRLVIKKLGSLSEYDSHAVIEQLKKHITL